MKKLDLHIHTVSTPVDYKFDFSMEKLTAYVKESQIDGIAITNHNSFDIQQYEEISKSLDNCVVLPGIEISIGNPVGHLICIADTDNAGNFSIICQKISDCISNEHSAISFDELKKFFGDFEKYLWIPHTDKSPNVSSSLIKKMSPHIFCGEVKSPKKFMLYKNTDQCLTPVYFSDFRPVDDVSKYRLRQTFFDIDKITVQTIKKCLTDKNKVSLSEKEGHSLFPALPDLQLSTGLNVIIGERSSGKSHTLDMIEKYNGDVKYIKQFELLEKDDLKESKNFENIVSQKVSDIISRYFREFINVVNEISATSIDIDNDDLGNYLSSLIKYANESDRADAFSKCKLYTESEFIVDDLSNLKGLIENIRTLIHNQLYQDIIDAYIPRKNIIGLYIRLMEEFHRNHLVTKKKSLVNELVTAIKAELNIKTATTKIPDVNFYDLQMNRIRIKKFNELAMLIRRKGIIQKKSIGKFTIQIKKREFNNATELNAISSKRVALKSIFKTYQENPFVFLTELKEYSQIDPSDYHKFFVFTERNVLNQYGVELSGGERAEFNLLNKLSDAYEYDMLLIDELESSFDNIFLKNQVNKMIKDISQKIPVILVTHNNTVGASIKPDFIVYTKRNIENGKPQYEHYSGLATSKELKNSAGKTIKNIDVTLDCLEAGEDAYEERKFDYEILRD